MKTSTVLSAAIILNTGILFADIVPELTNNLGFSGLLLLEASLLLIYLLNGFFKRFTAAFTMDFEGLDFWH